MADAGAERGTEPANAPGPGERAALAADEVTYARYLPLDKILDARRVHGHRGRAVEFAPPTPRTQTRPPLAFRLITNTSEPLPTT